MHSNIYQISKTAICPDDYATPYTYEDNSGDFADYIGDEIEGDARLQAIDHLADLLADVFDHKGGGEFVYKGADALAKFKQKWADELRRQASALSANNLFKKQNLFKLRQTTEETHLRTSYRVDIADWDDGIAYPFGELYEWADSHLVEGDCIYVGAIIDYHY